MDIAVATPTGNVGSRVVQLLVQAGLRPRVLVRDPARLTSSPSLLDIRRGDLMDAAFVAEAVTGADALFWATPEAFTSADPLADMERFGANAAAAVRAGGVERVVQISSTGADTTGNGLIDGLGRNEQQLRSSGAALLTLRCGYFFTNLSTTDLQAGVLQTTMPLDLAMPWVAPRDIAEVATVRLLAGFSGTSVVGVHGPADLSWSSVASILSSVLGREISALQITESEMRAGLISAGLPDAAADGMVGMGRAAAAEKRDELTTTPTTLASWAADLDLSV